MQVQSLGREDLLEEGIVTHSSTLNLENSTDRGAWQATVRGVRESDTTEPTFTFALTHGALLQQPGWTRTVASPL